MEFLVSILFLIGLFFSTRRSLHSSSEAKPRDSQNGNLVANPRYCGATLQVIHSSLPPLRTVFRELMQGTGAKLLCSLPPTSPSFLHIFSFFSLLSCLSICLLSLCWKDFSFCQLPSFFFFLFFQCCLYLFSFSELFIFLSLSSLLFSKTFWHHKHIEPMNAGASSTMLRHFSIPVTRSGCISGKDSSLRRWSGTGTGSPRQEWLNNALRHRV